MPEQDWGDEELWIVTGSSSTSTPQTGQKNVTRSSNLPQTGATVSGKGAIELKF